MRIQAFEILGVKPDSSLEHIKRTFREKVRKYHPDLNPGISSDKFREIVDAYNFIINLRKGKFALSENIDELFVFFVRKFLGDICIRMSEQDFEKTDKISYTVYRYCEKCRLSSSLPCMKCNGTGFIIYRSGKFLTKTKCPNCNGKGRKVMCDECGGEGVIKKREIALKKDFDNISEKVYKLEKTGNIYKNVRSDVYIKIF